MNLLFTRTQKRASVLSLIPLRIGGTVTFMLRAELELSQEELALARKYSFTKATLIASDTHEDLGKAYRPAIFVGFLAAIAIILFAPVLNVFSGLIGANLGGTLLSFLVAPVAGLVVMMVFTVIYFFSLRTHVSVDQLAHGGRLFHCHSVVELDDREAELLDICKRFYLTLEKAKNWGGREINPLPDGEPYYLHNPDGDEHRATLDRAMHQAGQKVAKLAEPFRATSTHQHTSEPPKTFFDKVSDVLFDPKPPIRTHPTEQQSTANTTRQPAQPNPPTPTASVSPPRPAPPNHQPPSTQPGQQSQPSSGTAPSRPSTLHPSHPLAPKPPDEGNPGF